MQRTHHLFCCFSVVSRTENLRKELAEAQAEELSVEFVSVPFKALCYNAMTNKHRQDALKASYCSLQSQCLGQ